MRKTKQEEQTKVVTVTEDILCNQCGESLKGCGPGSYEGLVEARICGGFGSKIGDMLELRFSICEVCLLQMFKGFKIEPEK